MPLHLLLFEKQEKLTANLDTIINNISHLTTFLNLGKTWINIKDMYILTYPSADHFCIDNLMRWCFSFQNSEQITGDTKSSCLLHKIYTKFLNNRQDFRV